MIRKSVPPAGERPPLRGNFDWLFGGFLFVVLFFLLTTILVLTLPDGIWEGFMTFLIISSFFLLAISALVGIFFSVRLRGNGWKLPVLSAYSAAVPLIVWVYDQYEPFNDVILASIIGGYILVTLWLSLGWFLHARRRFAR